MANTCRRAHCGAVPTGEGEALMGKLMSVPQIGEMIALAQKTLAESIGNVHAVRACSDSKQADHQDLERREIRIARVAAMHLQAEIAKLHALAVLADSCGDGVVYDQHGAILTTSDEIAEALLQTEASEGHDEDSVGEIPGTAEAKVYDAAVQTILRLQQAVLMLDFNRDLKIEDLVEGGCLQREDLP